MSASDNAPPTTKPDPQANGHPAELPPLAGMQFRPRPPDPVTGEIFLDVGPDLGGLLDDVGWFEAESWKGTWFPFMGKYIAIVNKSHVGTGDDRAALRTRVAEELGVNPERVLIEWLPPDFLVEG